jgi:hypothetical protein
MGRTCLAYKINAPTEKEYAMSTDYRLLKKVPGSNGPLAKVPACDLFDGRLEEFGVREHDWPGETKKSRCLTDGRNGVCVHIDDDGFVLSISRHGRNYPGKILNAVAVVFDVDIVSEYEPQYWGFDTQEEWDACMENMSKEAEEKFHIELLKYLRGEPNDIGPGNIGKAEIAKTLVEKDPSLLLPINNDKLRNEVRSIYDRENAVTVTLGPKDLALVRMLSTDEDDLPRA